MMHWFDVQILGHKIEVQLCEQVIIDGEVCLGASHMREGVIKICAGLPPSQTLDTLIHELVHIILQSLRTTLTDEEQICWHVGSGLQQALAAFVKLPPPPKVLTR